jgi:hypothetical protein
MLHEIVNHLFISVKRDHEFIPSVEVKVPADRANSSEFAASAKQVAIPDVVQRTPQLVPPPIKYVLHTLQAEAEVEPAFAVVKPFSHSKHSDLSSMLLHFPTGQTAQLADEDENEHPLPAWQLLTQPIMQTLNPCRATLLSVCQLISLATAPKSPVGAVDPPYLTPLIVR